MASLIQATRKPRISAAEVSTESLVQWRLDYLALEPWKLGPECLPLNAILEDQLDTAYIESLISQALLTTHVSKGFCNRCLDLFNHWPNLGTDTWTHGIGRTYHSAEIEAAARQGCRCCSYLFATLKDSEFLGKFRRIEQRFHILDEQCPISLSIENWGRGGDSQLHWLNFPGKTTDRVNSWAASGTKFESHVVPPSFYFEDQLDHSELIKRWLKTCSKDHSLCSEEPEIERPSRLIYVKGDIIRVVSTSSLETMPLYATLSYCRGGSDFLKLTEDNLNTFFDKIPQDSLPQVFRDAVQITQKAGLEYLWINALCIIQGIKDNSDWLKESGLMRSIFGGSHLNIAAASSTSVHDGYLSKMTNKCTGFLGRIQTDEYCRVQNFHSGSVYEDATTDSCLATEAWALQERLLAPHTLYLTKDGLFWECRSMTASDSLPGGFPGKLGGKLVRPPSKSWPWNDIVRLYSKANLTDAADKLPALSGIARRQHEVIGDEYLAGMWRKRLVKQLGWGCTSHTVRPKWRAPTWSWTSLDGQVNYWPYWDHEKLAKTEYVKVVSANTILAGEDPFGQVKGGELELSCAAIFRGEYRESLEESEGKDCHRVALETSQLLLPISLDCSEGDSIEVGSHLYILPLFGGESGIGRRIGDGDVTREMMIRGIVLKSIDDGQGHFQRVGSFDIRTLADHFTGRPAMLEEYTKLLHIIDNIDESTADLQHVQHLMDNEDSSLRFKVVIF